MQATITNGLPVSVSGLTDMKLMKVVFTSAAVTKEKLHISFNVLLLQTRPKKIEMIEIFVDG